MKKIDYTNRSQIVERGEKIIPPKLSVILAINTDDPYILPSENLYVINPTDSTSTPEEIVLYVSK